MPAPAAMQRDELGVRDEVLDHLLLAPGGVEDRHLPLVEADELVGGLALAAEYLTDPDADQSTTLFGLRYSF